MGLLQRFERRLEDLVGGAFARLFKGQVEPVEIAKALQREADENRANMGGGRVLVPNRYVVELGPSDHERLAPWETQLTRTLAEMVQEFVDEEGWSAYGDITVAFALDKSLRTGMFRVGSDSDMDAAPRQRPRDSLSAPLPYSGRSSASPSAYEEPYRPHEPRHREHASGSVPGAGFAAGAAGAAAGAAGAAAAGVPGAPVPGPHVDLPHYERHGRHEPSYDQGGYDQGGYDQPYSQQPGYDQPAYGQPGYDQPAYDQPAYDQGRHNASPYDQGGYGQQPGYDQPYSQQPGYDQPAYDQPAYDQPAYDQPAYDQPQLYDPPPRAQPVLVIDGTDRRHPVQSGSTVIGRGQESDLRLPDTGVSRRHAVVRFDGTTAVIEDLNSTNGTVVNGQRIRTWRLQSEDVIRVGHTVVIFRQESW